MAHFKFMLDRGVNHLKDCFPSKRVVSTETLGLRSTLADEEIIEYASTEGYLLVASNRRDFLRDAKRHVAQSSKKQFGCCRVPGMILLVPNDEITQRRVLKGLEKQFGCCRVPGMILLVPNDEITQRRVLKGLESRLRFERKPISYSDVHDGDLIVMIEASGKATVSRMPRCPHCKYNDDSRKE